MKLVSMSVSGFRGLPRPVTFDLDADAVIVVGVNGSGKTSFFDAMLWALSGQVDRLHRESAPLVSKYSETGEMRVELALRSRSGEISRVVRRYDGEDHLSVHVESNRPLTGPAAEAALLDLLWPDAQSASDPPTALNRSLTRATYLQQDAVRAFVTADDEKTRFQVVGELVGVGRIADLQRQLEAARNAWARVTTSLERELGPYVSQRAQLVDRLRHLSDLDTTDVVPSVAEWQRAADDALGSIGSPGGIKADYDGGETLDESIAALTRGEQGVLRRLTNLERLRTLLEQRPAQIPDIASLALAVRVAERTRDQAAAALVSAEASAAEQRRLEVELRDVQENLRALAQLAVRHLGETCPVCAQEYDRDATRLRLLRLIDASRNDASRSTSSSLVADAARELEEAEGALLAARDALRAARDIERAYVEWGEDVASVQQALGIGSEMSTGDVSSLIESTKSALAKIRELRSEGEGLVLQSTRIAEQAQRQNLLAQLTPLDAEVAERQEAIRLRNATYEEATSVISALRDANDSLVAEQLTHVEPILQRVFSAVDPHPTFRAVNFLTRTERGRGRLWTTLGDAPGGIADADPATVLSSSQLNVLAVSVFLALNLAIPTLPLQLVALDDPLQSLDNVNLLGLTDLLRRVKESRQVMVSTHDSRLANLLERKLRPIGAEARTVRIDLRGWSSAGPTVQQSVVEQDTGALRLVASA